MINTEKRNYAIGTGAGLAAGAGVGVMLKSKLAGRKLMREAKSAESVYSELLKDFKYNNLKGDTITKLGTIENAASKDAKVHELFERTLDDLGHYGKKRANKRWMKALRKKENQLLNLPENRDVKEAIENVTKKFNETKGKESFDKIISLKKEIKNKQVKGIAGLAVAGLVIGTVAAAVANKVKNKNNVKNTNSINVEA